MDPKGKVALVTGGARGIGLAICKELLKEGAKGVSICDIDIESGQKRIEEIEKQYGKGRAIFLKADVTKQQELEDAFKKTVSTFSCIDIVVNNAGLFHDLNWELEVDINVKGVIRGILLAYEFMGKNKGGNGGTVINMASISAVSRYLGIPIYSGLKSAVTGLTYAFGHPFYLKDTDVRMMAICPGPTLATPPVQGECRLLDPDWWTVMADPLCNDDLKQSAENVARGVVHMIREGSHGSIWVSIDEKPVQEIVIPNWEQLAVK